MKLKNIHLVNIRKHDDLFVDLNEESTMILGKNGSGKSTIVESILYLLYRHLLVDNVNKFINKKIIDVPADGSAVKYLDKSYIEGEFEDKGVNYKLLSGLAKIQSSLKIWDAATDAWVEKSNKIKDIYDFVQNEIMGGMSADYFLNTIYTAQMAILNLVDKTEGVRQREFDKLVGTDGFITIYDSLAKPNTELNKLFRSDIKELTDGRIEKSKRLESKTFERETELKKMNDSKIIMDHIGADSFNVSSCIADKETEYNRRLTIYNAITETSRKIYGVQDMVDDDQKKIDCFDAAGMDQKKTNLSNVLIKLNTDYKSIQRLSSEYVHYMETRINNLEHEINNLNADYNVHQMITMHKKGIDESIHVMNECQETIAESEKKLSDTCNLLSAVTDDYNNSISKVRSMEESLYTVTYERDVILKSYKNDNYNYDNVLAFLDGRTDEYISLKDNPTCLYCSSLISVESIIDGLKRKRLEYKQLETSIETLTNDLLHSRESLSILTATKNKHERCANELKSTIEYKQMVSKGACDKITHLKIRMEDETKKLINSVNDPATILAKLNSTKQELVTLRSSSEIKKLSQYVDSELGFNAVLHSPSTILASIDLYQKEFDSYKRDVELLNNEYSKYRMVLDHKNEHMSTLMALKDSLNKQMQENSISSINVYHSELTEFYNEINDLKMKHATIKKDYEHAQSNFEQLKLSVYRINDDIEFITKEIDKIDQIIKKNELVQKKLNMINIAKLYYKQDGLSMIIRKFFIEKLNKRMSEYVDLFNFEFIPSLDETAGIVEYDNYSGGQKIAIAILMKIVLNLILKNPVKMLILDEPTPYMDSERIEAIRDLVDKIKSMLQVIVITHDTEFMNIECNKILL